MGAIFWYLLPIDSSALAIYTVLFFVQIISVFGVPIPEEITLLAGGYLAYLEFTSFWPTVFILFAGAISGDMLTYLLGRWVGDWILGKLQRFRLASIFLKKAEGYLEKHGAQVIIWCRPLWGIRSPVLMLTGHLRVNFYKFLLFDIISALPWTILLVSFSYRLGSLFDLVAEAREIKNVFLLSGALFIIMYSAIQVIKNTDSSR